MPHPIDIHVGSQIRSLRRALKLSQTDLATRLGVSFQQIQKYETGANRVSASKLAEASDILGVSITYLFPERYQEQPLSSEEKTLVAAYRSADIESRELLTIVAEKVAEPAHTDTLTLVENSPRLGEEER
ncbi:helix-turn-helix domain-containing protein [Pseudosulfitobacter pseudonitzschiae]|uniref:helix-turn-helix domain-containing protein n=1 Tax=Pseudosulfitobacter pseudonitzschiae TaxID=1402135 RepID=UPI001AFB4E30|nr:helix-turn-helix domain-containing protein [Pseudosulfitobacter pseudonitzschiae]MBM1817343.1 helix-turn-helix domain-containing protein [Pseudosulfitobacter pseudonitzschiae]MBM1834354.1 helix-turn-helix domain-containing protein [Pseudosulfitobacter pseudonitzschiae]MBM1839219.1 helix-turn-helix domain-containing protein [Pseudosulfitobacter pseudonitzschiae]MBM1844069.1 helix-turn-helix domain-containing protein [Pseudosulfitobacter pseudonitzschiae]MBM1848904.1 helix-turn-helix domain-c